MDLGNLLGEAGLHQLNATSASSPQVPSDTLQEIEAQSFTPNSALSPIPSNGFDGRLFLPEVGTALSFSFLEVREEPLDCGFDFAEMNTTRVPERLRVQ